MFVTDLGCTRRYQTCQSIWCLIQLKAFWIHLFRCAQSHRPVALPGPIDDLSVEELRDTVIKSMRLDQLLAKDTLADPVRFRQLTPPSKGTEAHDTAGVEVQIWAGPLSDGIHLLSLSESNLMTLWDMNHGKAPVTIDLEGSPMCWDYNINNEGMTIVVQVTSLDGELFRVWRYNWIDPSPKEIISKLIKDIYSVWISKELAGCVMDNGDGKSLVYTVNWMTLDEVYLDIGIRYSMSVATIASSEDLFLYEVDRDIGIGLYCSYSLLWMKSELKPIGHIVQGPPDSTHSYIVELPHFEHGQLRPTNDSDLTFLWDGRVAIYETGSISKPFRGEYLTVSFLEDDDGLIQKGRVVPHITRWVKEPGFSWSLDNFNMHTVGIFSKTVFWLESSPNQSPSRPKHAIEKLCFADISPSRIPNPRTQCQKASESRSDVGGLSKDNLDGGLEKSLEHSNEMPSQTGHVCEFYMLQWVQDYRGIYSVEFDDARGRLVVATGSGKILIADFV
ncbi:hypothetical protein CPB86DRAFT_814485 [Serendipita vermifera]|nr:hypothetical protein CPB86DRAFT_814485 [Serendipita vermifera]